VYGRYALVAALAVVFSACSTLGVNETVGRHGAILAAERDRTGLRRLLGSLLALRLGSGLATAVAFGILTTLWLRDLDRVALAAAALAVMVRGIWLALFAFFLGLNQAARWGAGELINRWAMLALVPLGALVGGFRGACIGLLLSEGIVLAAGSGGRARSSRCAGPTGHTCGLTFASACRSSARICSASPFRVAARPWCAASPVTTRR